MSKLPDLLIYFVLFQGIQIYVVKSQAVHHCVTLNGLQIHARYPSRQLEFGQKAQMEPM